MNVFRTYIVRAVDGPLAVAVCDALGYPEKGMFVVQVQDGGTVAYISTGIVDSESPIHADAATLHAAILERNPAATVTLADCEAFKKALDQTDDDPFDRIDVIKAEIRLGATAVPWVQPTGAHDAYAKNSVVSYVGQSWRSLHDANVQPPGVSGWRLLWASTTAAPEWKQPSGGHDAYQMGDLVTFQGATYRSRINANVWSPAVYPAGWERV